MNIIYYKKNELYIPFKQTNIKIIEYKTFNMDELHKKILVLCDEACNMIYSLLEMNSAKNKHLTEYRVHSKKIKAELLKSMESGSTTPEINGVRINYT